MSRIGIIGTGRIGSMLVKGLVNNGALQPEEIIVQNRSREKMQSLAREVPGIKQMQTPKEVWQEAEIIFLCVKPQDIKDVFAETGKTVPADKLLVSTMLAPPLSRLEELIEGPAARVYPSIVQETGNGAALFAFGQEVSMEKRDELLNLFHQLGSTYEVPENLFRVCGDITSCGPAFMAYMIGSLARVAEKRGLDGDKARSMALETMLGTATWMQQNRLTFGDLVDRVATPGGCTGEGVKVMEKFLDDGIEQVFDTTAQKEKDINDILGDI
ncbi:MAG: pyrroline-5-carboxylate reductase [Clostridiales bacterium]|nr:pyrroline-5-carboxylate reductase [Clostridiales bacterium]MCF8023355.1 pyrroline-5-carboxylate reductase [Clostridiales bacterium]